MITDYVLAGYRVASRVDRWDWQDDSLPGTDLVSMSGCVADLLPADPQGFDDWFGDRESAQQALIRANRADLQVIGVGFALRDIPALSDDIADGGWDVAAGSLPERLARREPISEGRVLGFELVGYDSGLWHTWTCLGGLVRDVRQATGISPGRWGLLQDEREAHRAAGWLTESNLGDPKVFLWIAAMLVAYPTANE